jgi:hypothetical protein
MTCFSNQRTFLGGAISTAASALQGASVEVSRRSPLTPRRVQPPSSHGSECHSTVDQARYRAYSSPTYIPLPNGFSRPSMGKGHSGNDEDNLSPSVTLYSPFPSFHTPAPGKLGTFSAINIIFGKTRGRNLKHTLLNP